MHNLDKSMHQADEQWRLFVGLPISDEVKDSLYQWCLGNREQLPFYTWVHPADYHITLQFLGETSSSRVEEIVAALQEVGRSVPPFQLQASGIGTFGSPSRPRILWGGVEGELEQLKQLQAAVVAVNRSLGYVPEEREYSPHITLARKYSGSEALNLKSLINKGICFGDWTNDTILVYRTKVTVRPMYEIVGAVPLGT